MYVSADALAQPFTAGPGPARPSWTPGPAGPGFWNARACWKSPRSVEAEGVLGFHNVLSPSLCLHVVDTVAGDKK